MARLACERAGFVTGDEGDDVPVDLAHEGLSTECGVDGEDERPCRPAVVTAHGEQARRLAQVEAGRACGGHEDPRVPVATDQPGHEVGALLLTGLRAVALPEQDERGDDRRPLDGALVGVVHRRDVTDGEVADGLARRRDADRPDVAVEAGEASAVGALDHVGSQRVQRVAGRSLAGHAAGHPVVIEQQRPPAEEPGRGTR